MGSKFTWFRELRHIQISHAVTRKMSASKTELIKPSLIRSGMCQISGNLITVNEMHVTSE